jgi:hypothetical protein
MREARACLAPRVVESLSPRLNHDWLRQSFARAGGSPLRVLEARTRAPWRPVRGLGRFT